MICPSKLKTNNKLVLVHLETVQFTRPELFGKSYFLVWFSPMNFTTSYMTFEIVAYFLGVFWVPIKWSQVSTVSKCKLMLCQGKAKNQSLQYPVEILGRGRVMTVCYSLKFCQRPMWYTRCCILSREGWNRIYQNKPGGSVRYFLVVVFFIQMPLHCFVRVFMSLKRNRMSVSIQSSIILFCSFAFSVLLLDPR